MTSLCAVTTVLLKQFSWHTVVCIDTWLGAGSDGVDVVIQSADAAAVQSPQPSASSQPSDDSDDVLMQSAELKRTEMKLIRQIESIQEERSVCALDKELLVTICLLCCLLFRMQRY